MASGSQELRATKDLLSNHPSLTLGGRCPLGDTVEASVAKQACSGQLRSPGLDGSQ